MYERIHLLENSTTGYRRCRLTNLFILWVWKKAQWSWGKI